MASGTCKVKEIPSNRTNMEPGQLNINWEDVLCPICLDFPHNGVLLQCSSYDNGCRPFMCDTDHTHSNCLDRFKMAHGMSADVKDPSPSDTRSQEGNPSTESHGNAPPTCPLCRGEVTGWIVLNEARAHLNKKTRCCEEAHCAFIGNYLELQDHAKLKHPHARPSKIDPARQLDWDNFQQSSEIIDVLSTIHSEVPHGVVLGDYVIEYGENDMQDEFEDFPGDEGNWWTSCILYQVFDNFRASRNRRRSRANETRRGRQRPSYDASNSDEGSVTSVDIVEYRVDDNDVEFFSSRMPSRGSSGHRRIWIPKATLLGEALGNIKDAMPENVVTQIEAAVLKSTEVPVTEKAYEDEGVNDIQYVATSNRFEILEIQSTER
ncbi:hypothetical protein IFM89_030874 [Coptis chinensis]|uniref:Uncharacterized protein n=1 Tax=Coptis chinensis TaxID=261450 RepID=A0A835ICY4_9MAGN|nr:hypothetical protein IFM89_030874 [Coptis chinensis]